MHALCIPPLFLFPAWDNNEIRAPFSFSCSDVSVDSRKGVYISTIHHFSHVNTFLLSWASCKPVPQFCYSYPSSKPKIHPFCSRCLRGFLVFLYSLVNTFKCLHTSLYQKKQKLEFCLALLGALGGWYGDPTKRFSNL